MQIQNGNIATQSKTTMKPGAMKVMKAKAMSKKYVVVLTVLDTEGLKPKPAVGKPARNGMIKHLMNMVTRHLRNPMLVWTRIIAEIQMVNHQFGAIQQMHLLDGIYVTQFKTTMKPKAMKVMTAKTKTKKYAVVRNVLDTEGFKPKHVVDIRARDGISKHLMNILEHHMSIPMLV